MANFTTGIFTSVLLENDGKGNLVNKGKTVNSKYLFDKNGKEVIDPTTGKPYIVPADMNFDQMVINLTDKYNTNIGTAPIDSTKILMDFRSAGGTNDLQRMDVNGQPYGGFVSDYTSVASLYFGAVSAGLAVPNNIAEIGGGLLNLKNYIQDGVANPSGDYFNNPKNVPNIQNGLSYYQKNISTNSALDTLINAFDVGVDFIYDLAHLPVDIVNSLFSGGKSFDFRVDNSAAILSDSILKDLSYLGINPLSTTTSYKDTTVITLTPNANSTNIKYESYDVSGTKISETVSAYNTTGDLIGRTTSQHQTGDFITVPTAASPSSVLETLKQTQEANLTLAQDASKIANIVGMDQNGTISSDWLMTPAQISAYNNYYNSYYVDQFFYPVDSFSFSITFGGSSGGYSFYVQPVILDLDGDGVELTAIDESRAWFNIVGDGKLYKSGWVGADDGLLVCDENGGGEIAVREMAFASRTVADDTDLVALASEFDTNKNGRLDSGDTQFAKFRIWKDSNGNGETDAGELMTLSQANNLNFKNTRSVA